MRFQRILHSLTSPWARIVTAVALAAFIAFIAYRLQTSDIVECMQGGGAKSVCESTHRDFREIAGISVVALLLLLTPEMLRSDRRAKLGKRIDRLHRNVIRPPQRSEERHRLQLIANVGLMSAVTLSLSLPLWLATTSTAPRWGMILAVLTVAGVLGLSASVILAVAVTKSRRAGTNEGDRDTE